MCTKKKVYSGVINFDYFKWKKKIIDELFNFRLLQSSVPGSNGCDQDPE